ncbi:uncharacterized protein LOC135155445 [Lytechinus pictus]|uniref:uncharacterized protein LOC135155445 n=1 Tax=Lytechinus pictus TaxID=7653 RepID=UPI0030BA0C27
MGILTELMCDNGTLSAPVPSCYENCDVDAIPFSNQTTADSLDHDESIVIACNSGFSTGMGILTELMCDNGTLSAPVPSCYENCDVDAIPFSNQTTADSLDHDASIVIACNSGYSTGMGILTELMCDNGTLSAPVPSSCNSGYSSSMGILTELMCDNGTLSAPVPVCYGKILLILDKSAK